MCYFFSEVLFFFNKSESKCIKIKNKTLWKTVFRFMNSYSCLFELKVVFVEDYSFSKNSERESRCAMIFPLAIASSLQATPDLSRFLKIITNYKKVI